MSIDRKASEPKDSRAADTSGVERARSAGAARGTILVVDDEEGVRQVCKMMLDSLGFQVLLASTGEEAVAVFREHAAEVRCVILDLTMPRTDGVAIVREIRKFGGDAKVILSSGFGEQEALHKFGGEGLDGFLQKPYRLKNLQEELARALGD
jgi:CheY-like chemotaxis protein